MPKALLKSLAPWLIFLVVFGYDQYRMQIGAIGALLALLILSRRGLLRGLIMDWAALLFLVMVLAAVFTMHESWIALNAELIANIILTLLAWSSLLFNRPFTFEYTKQTVAKEYWQTMLFTRINLYLTVLWAITFTALTVLNVLYLYQIGDEIWVGEIMPIALVLIALWISLWFPDWCKKEELGRGGVITLQGLSDLHQQPVPGGSFSYRTLGHGMPLIMLPASHMSMYGWDPELVERLSRRYQVILIDYPGVGESSLDSEIEGIGKLCSMIEAFVYGLGIKKAIFVGYVMGGWAAQWLAIQHSQVVEGIVLIASDTGGSRAASISAEKLRVLHDPSGTIAEQNERLLDMIFPKLAVADFKDKMYDFFRAAELVRKVPQAAIDQQEKIIERWYSGEGTYAKLSEIQVPSLVIMGVLDIVVHRQNSLLLKNGIQQAKLIEYSDAGHGVIYQYPGEIANSIIDFFKDK